MVHCQIRGNSLSQVETGPLPPTPLTKECIFEKKYPEVILRLKSADFLTPGSINCDFPRFRTFSFLFLKIMEFFWKKKLENVQKLGKSQFLLPGLRKSEIFWIIVFWSFYAQIEGNRIKMAELFKFQKKSYEKCFTGSREFPETKKSGQILENDFQRKHSQGHFKTFCG